MHKTEESSRRYETEAWLLKISVRGLTRGDVYLALRDASRRLRRGKRSGAESGDTWAYIYKLQEAGR